MATYNAELLNKRSVIRCTSDGDITQYEAAVTIPAGNLIAINDVLAFCFMGAGQVVKGITIFTSQLEDTGSNNIVWDVGFSQVAPGTGFAGTNAGGVSIDYGVDTGVTGTSPATNTTFFVTGSTFGRSATLYNELTLAAHADPNGLAGPVRLIATCTTAPVTVTLTSTFDRTVRFLITLERAPAIPQINIDRGGYT